MLTKFGFDSCCHLVCGSLGAETVSAPTRVGCAGGHQQTRRTEPSTFIALSAAGTMSRLVLTEFRFE